MTCRKPGDVGWVVALMVLCGMVPVASAATQKPQTEKPPATPANAPAAPSIMDGAITALDLTSSSPNVTVTTENGKTWQLTLDPTLTVVWRNDQLPKATLEQLKIGERVKVHCKISGEKSLAASILVLQDPTMTAPPAAPVIPSATPTTAAPSGAAPVPSRNVRSH